MEDPARSAQTRVDTAGGPEWPFEWINTEIIEQMPTAVVVLDLHRKVMATNRAMRRLFGFGNEDSVRGIDVLELIHTDERASIATYLEELSSGRLQRHAAENECLAAGDRAFRGRLVASPIFDSSGRVRAVCCLITDITVEVSDRQALRGGGGAELVERGPVDRQAVTSFVASVGHELRAPLHGILGLSEILAESDLPLSDLKLVNTIRKEAGSLQLVVEDLLDLSRIESGRMALRAEPFTPAATAAEVRDLVGPEAGPLGLELTVVVGEDVPHQVVGDRLRIRQVLLHLVTNSVRHTQSGAVSINVDYRDDGVLVLEVSDTGPVIPEDRRADLFDAFAQSHDGQGGTGLGLTVVRQLTELMQGEVSMTSEPGVGSTYRVEVPVARADRRRNDQASDSDESADGSMTTATPHAPAPAALSGPTATAPSTPAAPAPAPTRAAAPGSAAADTPTPVAPDGSRLRVLVADDTEVNQLLAKNQLAKLGYEPVVVKNGHEALSKATSEPFSAVLMDWHMPVMDGLEATRRIRASGGPGRTIPIIAVTANVLHGNRDICIEAGMNDFLTKPVGIDDLREALQRWITTSDHDPMAYFSSGSPAGGDPADREPSDRHPSVATEQVSPQQQAQIQDQPQSQDQAQEQSPPQPEPGSATDPAEPVVAIETLDALAEELGDKAVVDTVIETFLDELDDRRESIAAIRILAELSAEECDDAGTEAMRSAHTLKSTSALLGGMPLADKCQTLESLLRDGDYSTAAGLVEETLSLIERTRAALRDHLAGEG